MPLGYPALSLKKVSPLFLCLSIVLFACKSNSMKEAKQQQDTILPVKKQPAAVINIHPAPKLVIRPDAVIDVQSATPVLNKASEGDDMIPQYKTWNLSPASVAAIIKHGEPIDMHIFHYQYLVLPCEVKGEVKIDSSMYSYTVNAGSYFTISNTDTSYYFACDAVSCKKFFLAEKDVHE